MRCPLTPREIEYDRRLARPYGLARILSRLSLPIENSYPRRDLAGAVVAVPREQPGEKTTAWKYGKDTRLAAAAFRAISNRSLVGSFARSHGSLARAGLVFAARPSLIDSFCWTFPLPGPDVSADK